jgi:hypothetical protein
MGHCRLVRWRGLTHVPSPLTSQETKRILGLDPEEKEVIDSYYPNPLLELLYSMRDCIIDEINGAFSQSTDLVLKFVDTADNLDVLIWSLLSTCRFPKELVSGSKKGVRIEPRPTQRSAPVDAPCRSASRGLEAPEGSVLWCLAFAPLLALLTAACPLSHA